MQKVRQTPRCIAVAKMRKSLKDNGLKVMHFDEGVVFCVMKKIYET